MGRMVIICAIVALTIWLVRAQETGCPEDCRTVTCDKPEGCNAGLVRDECGCCDVCAKEEGELCDHPEVSSTEYLGRCGENMECKLRVDLSDEAPAEAICLCTMQHILCGSDNSTYDNICHLMSSATRKNIHITIQHKGPCRRAPRITFPPVNVQGDVGENVAIGCEAHGYPIPTIEWTWTRVDGKTVYLPSDDMDVLVNVRGGPMKYHVSGWLQVMNLKKSHEGDYTCIVQNDYGIDQSEARLNVKDNKYDESVGKKRHPHIKTDDGDINEVY